MQTSQIAIQSCLGDTQIVSAMVIPLERPSDSKDQQKIALHTRYIKILSYALIVIAALCLAIVGVFSWHMVRSAKILESQTKRISQLTEMLQHQEDSIKDHDSDIGDVKMFAESAAKVLQSLNTAYSNLTETVEQQENVNNVTAKLLDSHENAFIRLIETVKRQEEVNNETGRLLHSQQNTISNLSETLKQQEKSIKDMGRNHDSDIAEVRMFAESTGESASTYTRWGRSVCPPNGTELVYDGYVGGSRYYDKGGASNYVCLTKQPLWGNVQNGIQNDAMMYGAEYQFASHTGNGKDYFGKDLIDFDVPCAVCRTTRPTVIMIPGRNRCFDGWTLEYHGYLAANDHTYLPTEYTCIDESPTTVTQYKENEDGALFYLVEIVCGSLKCPPYIHGGELTCVVCSK